MSGPADILDEATPLVHVRVTHVRGSAPREVGAEMFVSSDAAQSTIGGGQLEYMAIDTARALLRAGGKSDAMDVPLGPEIGQCCGGHVSVSMRVMSAADRDAARAKAQATLANRPHVYILGAGHVGRALACQLQHLPVRCHVIDTRSEELSLVAAAVDTRLTALPEADIRAAAPGSAFVVVTHDHALDFLLTSEALARADAAYVGLIGSATKRARLERFLRETAPDTDISRLTCPIGAQSAPDKRPEVIAACVVVEVLAAFAKATARKAVVSV